MNRNSRRGRVPRRNESTGRLNVFKGKGASDIEEVLSPRVYRKQQEKSVANRCCYVCPDQKDFGQSTDIATNSNKVVITDPFEPAHVPTPPPAPVPPDRYHSILTEQYGFEPLLPEAVTRLQELKKVLCCDPVKVENSSQYAHQRTYSPPMYVETSDGSHWQNVDNVDDIDKIILKDGKVSPITFEELPKHVFISEIPRVKIIAEKFCKYKRNNLELRRLDEKVVCVEYDIFDQTSNGEILKPIQRMRAFFSIKPNLAVEDSKDPKKETNGIPKLPSNIKRKFDILDDDLEKLTDKEIEIIDGTIAENKTYLDDFRRILKRKQTINAKKKKTSLDLQSLYDMAKKERPPLDCDYSEANLLSKAELQEVKDLILQRCASSVHGISRRRVKPKEETMNAISESIVAELLKEDAKFNVYH